MPPIVDTLVATLARHWWVLLLRGLAAIVFALLTSAQPDIALAALVLLFGAYVLIEGVLGVGNAIAARRDNREWWLLLLWAVAGVVVGVLTFMRPDVTTLALLYYIAAWALVSGVMQIGLALRVRRAVTGEWALILSGALSVLFGVLLFAQPASGAVAIAWLIALYAYLYGVLLVLLALKLRKAARSFSVVSADASTDQR